MATWYRYAVLRAMPDKLRGEVVNVGLVVVTPEGKVDIEIPDQMNKVAALDSELKHPVIADMASEIGFLTDIESNSVNKEPLIEMACTGILRCSTFSDFRIDSPDQYRKRVNDLLKLLVLPVRHKRKATAPRITTKIKRLFEKRDILGAAGDIDKHLVVPQFPIDTERGFKADFALKNGVMHITQTIDMNTTDQSQKHAQAALHGLTLDRALDVFGQETRRYVVYSATKKNQVVNQTLNLLGDHTDEMFNLESSAETREYLELIESAIVSSTQNSSGQPPIFH